MLCCPAWVKGVLCLSKAFFVCEVPLSCDEMSASRTFRESSGPPEPGKENETRENRDETEKDV